MKKRKKGILLILSLLMVLMSLSSAGAGCKKGDANMDGDVDHADLYEIKELLRLGDACGPVPECADYDGDGSITVFDVRSVLMAISKECVPGDANTSGHLTVADICKVEKMIAHKEYSKCADCNEDGVLNEEDLACLRSKVE
ncbi:MAG: dockerin type I domain-containing protein [Candidatus Electrothrix sp.]